MTIKENKHTICYRRDGDESSVLFITRDMVSNSPEPFKDAMERLFKACAFLEQFGLSGHFLPHKHEGKPTASCQFVTPIEMDIKKLLDGDGDGGDPTIWNISPSLSFCAYTGLRYILGSPHQLLQSPRLFTVTDSSDIIGWDKHKIFYVCFNKSESDVTTGVFIFKEDADVVLRLVGSYSGLEDKLVTEEGEELDAPENVKKMFRNLYGKDLLEKQIRDVIGD